MVHPVDVHVGKAIKRLRCALRMSQSDLAELLGLSFQQIQKYETAKNRVSASRLYEIARVLKVEIQYFYAGYEDPRDEM